MAIQHSPAEHLRTAMAAASARANGAVALRERPFSTQFNLYANATDAAAVEERLGVAPPSEPNTWAGPEPLVVWLSPGEWLVLAESRAPAALAEALEGAPVAVVDLSDQHAVFELTGPAVRDVLAAGCSLDLHPRVFAAGRCAQTLLAGARVTLVRLDDAWLVLVRRSMTAYLAHTLLDAMAEHQA